MGLIPAFMIKGTTSTIATLWSIPDLHGQNSRRDFTSHSILKLVKKRIVEEEVAW